MPYIALSEVDHTIVWCSPGDVEELGMSLGESQPSFISSVT